MSSAPPERAERGAGSERIGAGARRRQTARLPGSAAHHDLLGQVHLARRETERAEAAYLKALELQPQRVGTYVRLGDLYAGSGKYDQALARLDQALKVNPRNQVALMLSGVAHQRKGDVSAATAAYEKVLALNPRSALAANNLAWLLAEHGGDKERALQLAQMAKELAPEDAHVSDTLGWILYQRGIYHRALALFKESAVGLPESPEVQYRLGLASLKVGDKDGARRALGLAGGNPPPLCQPGA